jgi:hypothetical protein
MQGCASVGPVVFRPKQGGECIALVALAVNGKVGQQNDGFTRIHLYRHALALDARRAQQVQIAGAWQLLPDTRLSDPVPSPST